MPFAKPGGAPITVFLVVGEESGDQLGASLMAALRLATDGKVRFLGLGGGRMEREGLTSIFPMADISIMGLTAVFAALPRIYRRIAETVTAAIAASPDVLIIIDSPEFTQRVARRVHRAAPAIPIVNYVSPSVWAWRPGRARAMSAYVDTILALLPFEPEVHRRLGGPRCIYVGHPLVERITSLRPTGTERAPIGERGPVKLLALPGSRMSEVGKLMRTFGATIELTAKLSGRPIEVVLPAVPHLAEFIQAAAAEWPIQPTIVVGEEAKFAAFRQAHLALAASGTVTLELALAGVPLVVAYPLDFLSRRLRWLARVPSIVLPNLILGENPIPEFIDREANPEALAAALHQLMGDSPQRRRQLAAFERLDGLMKVPGGLPSACAAEAVLATVQARSATAT